MRPVNRYIGASVTASYLTIHYRMEIGGAIRFCEVKIPIRSLEAEVFHDAMELAERGVRLRHEEALDRQQRSLF